VSNCEFANFFYDLNAIFTTNQYGTKISISGSTFTRISNWGSIIKNYNSYPTNAGSEVTDMYTDRQAYFNYKSLTIVNKHADIYHATAMTINPFETTCTTNDWFMLSIQSSTFTLLSDQKELLTGGHVVPDGYQRYQAMAVNLVGFNGDVTLKGNTFTNNYVMIDGCVNANTITSPAPTNTNIEYLSTTATLYQIKSLISIMSHPKLIVLGENVFTANVGMKGIVMLESTKQKTHPIFIIGNTFTSNSGFFYADALYIRKINDIIYNPDLVQSNHYWAGLYIASNTFTNNIGCQQSTRGSLLAYWYSSTDPTTDDFYTHNVYMDHQDVTSKEPVETDKIKFLSTVNPSGFTTNTYSLSYGGAYGIISFNMEKVEIFSNSFTSNYGGKDGAVLMLQGFPYMDIQSWTFQYNGNNIPDFTFIYSTITSKVQSSNSTLGLFSLNSITDTYLSSYSYKMIGILSIDMVNQLTLTNLNFINNWIIDQGATVTVSHAIRIVNMYKSFLCTNWQFTQNKGISNDPVLKLAANNINFDSLSLGINRPLLNFQNFFFRYLLFSNRPIALSP
jgi:hypothetical protein